MIKSVLKYALQYLAFVLVFMLQKPVFMLFNADTYEFASFADYFSVMLHGLPHDFALAGYLSAIPCFIIIAQQWLRGRGFKWLLNAYYAIVALIIALAFAVDAILYGHWGTKLDTTPLFYLTSSPTAAIASVSIWFVVLGFVIYFLISGAYFWLFRKVAFGVNIEPAAQLGSRIKRSAVMLLLTALLVIPIRGGFTVATMNVSAVYYSSDIRLNHAAVNPLLSFMYALAHETDFDGQFNYFETEEAHAILAEAMKADGDSITPILNKRRPDIFLVKLESFSKRLMPSLGGENVAVELEKIAAEGLLFTNCYSSTFRTDRAIPAIISAFPAQPTTSITKYSAKAETLPSISAALNKAGYKSTYYYGGDPNYTNRKAYLMACGFDPIISAKDFPIADRMSKWGVVDHKVLERCAVDFETHTYDSINPLFSMIQTSSSHEPFDVPYANPRFADNPAYNAFAYTDSCAGDFIRRLKASGNWDNSLIIFIADHQGAYPRNLEGTDRFHIPMIFTGGALTLHGTYSEPTSQTDMVATVLGQLGIDHSEFAYSKNVFDASTKHWAAFSHASTMGFVTPTDTVLFSLEDGRLMSQPTPTSEQALNTLKAFYQSLYDDIASR